MKKLATLTSSITSFIAILPVYASEVVNGLDITAKQADITTENQSNLPVLVGALIGYTFTIIGTVFLILILVGGFQWMTARGNEDQVETAKKRIFNSVFGLMAITLAYVLVYTVLGQLGAAIK